MEAAFTTLRSTWRNIIDAGIKAKREFQKDADECMRFFDGPNYDMYGGQDGGRDAYMYTGIRRIARPSMCVSFNKVAEGVQLFGPSFYYRNPACKVNPRKPPDISLEIFGNLQDPFVQAQVQPIMQQMTQQQQTDTVRAVLLSGVLNWVPTAIDLKTNSRDAIDEAFIKGIGFLWATVQRPAGGRKMMVLEQVPTNNVIVDPDHNSIKDARWIARLFCKPVWEVEYERGLPPGTLKGNYESTTMSSSMAAIGNDYRHRQGKTSDLLVYWGIWSKMGLGGLLRGISPQAAEADRYGQYVYVEVCEQYKYFLNVPPEIWDNDDEVRRRVQWETPFWRDVPSSNGWPFTPFYFHKVPDKTWPASHFKFGMGELKFINWAYSFLISGMQKRSRDFIAVQKALSEELKTKLLEGNDLELLEFDGSLNIPVKDAVSFIEHPGFPDWQFKVIQAVEEAFDKRVGLTELMYGLQPQAQDRSATATQAKQAGTNIRPDDMANQVEDAMTDSFRKLALMARWHFTGEDIGLIFGPVIGQLWDRYVATADVDEIINQIEYRVEAGSTRKPNKAKDQEDAKNLTTQLFPVLSQFAMQSGVVDQFNALVTYWGKAFDMDVQGMLLPQPPPPPPQPEVAPETQDMAHKEMAHQQGMRHDDEKHKQAMKLAKEKASGNGKAA